MTESLSYVAWHGKESGFVMPWLLIASKNDLDPYPMSDKDSAKICLEMGIDAPIPMSVKDRDLNNVFSRIVKAAEHPHLNVPETDIGRSKKQCRHLVNRALMCLSAVSQPDDNFALDSLVDGSLFVKVSISAISILY